MENQFKQFGMSDKVWETRLATLTEKQLLYFQIMLPKEGVLYIQSKPGIAKSATAKAIAVKMGMVYFDIRLSMVDETDVGLYPNVNDVDIPEKFTFSTENVVNSGVTKKTLQMKVLSHVVPEWSVKANSRPTLIHFEELNRASLHVRNAALQLLLEREIGINFKFNDGVYMMASGNLGEEDGTDVEEFDNALNNRLIFVNHSLSFDEWKEDFANEHICPTILGFLNGYPEYLYKDPTENRASYATPRSWTFLSAFIFKNYGSFKMDENNEKMFDENGVAIRVWGSTQNWLPIITKIGASYIGDTITRFVRYCEENISVNIFDILDRYKELEKDIREFTRDRKSELLISMRDLNLEELSNKQIDNSIKFLKLIGSDERTGHLLSLLDKNNVKSPNTKRILSAFKDELSQIQVHNKSASVSTK